MFVTSNKLSDLLPYYKERLADLYPISEIENIFYMVCDYKHNLKKISVQMTENHLSESELLMHRDIIKRLRTNEPIQHIIGEIEFYDLPFRVNSSVLVPRPETEELVDLILSMVKNETQNILDIGTGSGCIPVSLKQNLPNSKLTAIDISSEALKVANENAKLNNVKVTFLEKNILSEDLSDLQKQDVIISNPPYVLESDKIKMNKNVLDFDPHLALFVDDANPLLFYKRIIELAKNHLNPKGLLFFEIHEKFGMATESILIESGFYDTQIVKDMQGKDRMVFGRIN